MSEPTEATAKRRSEVLWRVIIIGIFVAGLIVAVGFPLLNGNWYSIWSSFPVFAFGILIAAIRSIRP